MYIILYGVQCTLCSNQETKIRRVRDEITNIVSSWECFWKYSVCEREQNGHIDESDICIRLAAGADAFDGILDEEAAATAVAFCGLQTTLNTAKCTHSMNTRTVVIIQLSN